MKTCYGVVGDTLNWIAHAIERSGIDWVHVRHEEAGAFAAGAEAQLTGHLTACACTCEPGSLHFINGLYEANRNRAPVVLIATQIERQDLVFEFDEIADRAPAMNASILVDLAHDPLVRTGVLVAVGALVTLVLLRRYPPRHRPRFGP